MKFIGFLLLISCLMGAAVKAQSSYPAIDTVKYPPPVMGKNDTISVPSIVLDGKLTPWIVTETVEIRGVRIFASEQDRQDYDRLRYNVLKVLPYAQFAGERYRQLQRDLAVTADKNKQKELVNTCETQIKDLFNKEIKNLTISQGEILIKLINRETGTTSYEMVKDLKGGFKAFMFQSIASLFGHNLKETYDTDEERDIEAILNSAGYNPTRN